MFSFSVVLFARCWVKDSYNFYDFFSSVAHNESFEEHFNLLQRIQNEIFLFKEQILKECPFGGYLSNSYDGNWLEANHLAVNLFDRHNLSRDFCRTGLSIVTLTAGQCVFLVDQKLTQYLKFKTADNGIFVHVVCFSLPPLFAVPNMRFLSANNDWIVPHWFNCSFFVGEKNIDLSRCIRMPKPEFSPLDFSQVQGAKVEKKETIFHKMRFLSLNESDNSSYSGHSSGSSEAKKHHFPSYGSSSSSQFNIYSNHCKVGSFCRKWLGIIPENIDQIYQSIVTDWNSLLNPPSLPVETDFFPSVEELSKSFRKYSYSLIPIEDSPFCKKENSFDILVEQRLL